MQKRSRPTCTPKTQSHYLRRLMRALAICVSRRRVPDCQQTVKLKFVALAILWRKPPKTNRKLRRSAPARLQKRIHLITCAKQRSTRVSHPSLKAARTAAKRVAINPRLQCAAAPEAKLFFSFTAQLRTHSKTLNSKP